MGKLLVFLGSIILLMMPAYADNAAPSEKTDAVSANQDEAWLKEVTCRKMPPPTGTMLGARKICQTNKEWRDQTMQAQRYVSGMQQRLGGAAGPGANGN